jgi:tetratricopeptide (TPR) repeat protein
LALLLVVSLVQAARQAVNNAHAMWNSREAIRRADHWDPWNPEFPEQFGRALAGAEPGADPQEVASAFEDTIRLGRRRPDYWANLGASLDLAGKTPEAMRAYERALELFPRSPTINWQFAKFLVRSGDATKATEPLRLVIAGNPSLWTGAFDLAWRAGMPREQILEIIPARQEVLSVYLDYLAGAGRLDAAAEVWQRLLASPESFDLEPAFHYFDALLYAHRADQLTSVWAGLARHDPGRIPWQPGGANRITNGGFEEAGVNGGFDWRITPIEGAYVSFDTAIAHEGLRSLRVRFYGKHNLDFGHVAQYVAVEPNTRYRFTANARCKGITTDSGPRIAVYDAYDHAALSVETEGLSGTADWQEQKLEFRTGAQTQLLVVQVVRPPSRDFDNQFAGTLWLDDFSLTAVP